MKKIREWMHRHQNTSSFLTNFVATVLGIVLTLGTTVWYDHHQKTEAAEILVEQCLTNMEDRLLDLDDAVNFYDMHIEWFKMLAYNRVDSLTEDELSEVVNIYTMQRHLLTNHAFEKSYSQSTASHETLGRFSEVIGTGFEFLQHAEENHAAINRLKNDFTRQQILSNNIYQVKESMHDVVMTAITDPLFSLFRTEYAMHEQSVRQMQKYLHYYIPAARRLWQKEITDDEFWTEVGEKWNEL